MNRNKVTKLAFGIVFICFLLSTSVSLWSLRLMVGRNTQELSKALAARIYDTITSDLSEPVVVARTMASDRFLQHLLEKESDYSEAEAVDMMRDYLSGLRKGLNCEAAFVVSAATGRYYSYTGLNKIINPGANERDQWYSDFLEGGKEYDMDVDRDEVSQDAWMVFVDCRIEDTKGRLLGVCGVGVEMRGSQALFNELEGEYQVKLNLIDGDGVIQVDTDENRLHQPLGVKVRTSQSEDYVYQTGSGNSFIVTKYVERLGWYLVVQIDGSRVTGQFINVVILNVGLCLVMMVILVLAIRIIVERTRALTHASFRDQSTQLWNRRAFEEDKERLLTEPFGENFVYVTADVNGLKAANDTLGHAAGDELIQGAAQCLKACFGEYGRVYRIGGDEFAAMLNLTPDQLRDAVARFEAMVDGWRGEKVERLSVSCGYALGREHPSENITELGRISDEMMYAAKAEHYRKHGGGRG